MGVLVRRLPQRRVAADPDGLELVDGLGADVTAEVLVSTLGNRFSGCCSRPDRNSVGAERSCGRHRGAGRAGGRGRAAAAGQLLSNTTGPRGSVSTDRSPVGRYYSLRVT